MKQKVLNKLHFMLPLLAAVLLIPQYMAAQTRIAVVSDIHVMAPSLLPEEAKSQEAWKSYYGGQRKMVEQSVGLFDQFVSTIKGNADILLITGDLTKDGEQASHNYVREKLKTLGMKVYVIPGNHDFGGEGNHTQFNADGSIDDAPVLSTADFKTTEAGYGNYGYGEGSTLDPEGGSLSYVVEPVNGLVLLAIDSHTESIPSKTLTWLCNQAKDARAKGKQVIAMMHHPLIEHIKGANMFVSTYTVGSNEDVRDALIEAGVNVILTGHFHTSDIAYDWNVDKDNGIYDINTGSLISYPCDYRVLTLSKDMQKLSVATASLEETPDLIPSDATSWKTWMEGRVRYFAEAKLKKSPYNLLSNDEKSFVANMAVRAFSLHAEGNENGKTASAALIDEFDNYNGTTSYYMAAKMLLSSTFKSILTNTSHYGEDHADQTADRTLEIALPSLDETVTLSAEGWASYCSGHDLDISQTEGVIKVYTVTATTENAATLTEVTEIPAEEGFLLRGSPSTAYTLKATSGVSPITNLLIGTLTATEVPAGSFVLASRSDIFGFYPTASGLEIPAHKAYLPSTTSPSRMLVIAGETTGISTLETEDQNQQTIYTLQGTRASSLHRGLYIQNGKKIIIK